MNTFETYLAQKGFAKPTICQHSRYVSRFLEWLQTQQINPSDCTYNDLLSWTDHRRGQKDSIRLINCKLLLVRHYFSFFQLENKEVNSPAAGLRLENQRKRLLCGITGYEKLEQLYQCCQVTDGRTLRNKVILSLLIYQGVTTDELHRLKTGHVNLKEGRIKIPGSKRSNGRILHMQAFHILDLQQYLLTVRTRLTKESEGQFFLSMEGKRELKNSLFHLFRALKQTSPDIKNAGQIRQSVIVHWLRHHNLRQTQYVAGHKYVSSTERYRQNNIDDLQKEIERLHPLNNSIS